MRFSEPLAVLGLTGVGLAAPYTPNGASLIEGWQAFSGLFNGVNNALTVTVSELLDELGDALNKGDRAKTLDTLEKLKPTIKLKSIADASSITEKSQSQPNGTASESTNDLLSHAQGFGSAENGNDNRNPNPPKSVYPKAASCDAPYSLSEDKLRSAIYIPDTFTYGEKLPVILFPGTGATGWTSLRGNFIPLLTDVDWADPVRVNVPGLLLDDGQVNAEYAAYAINYIASLSKRSVSIIDELVQPQEGTGASAYLLDERNGGVTNVEVQKVCAGKPGGSFYTHESMLINPLSSALAKNALTHDGPGEISRLDLGIV
ncbi:hypothetical protein H9Q72_014097 [Fusarium xylarioides]|uniref:Uncharacterized protein n=1 Tax=Fusarium xylarioides TaxID=221167 RepID=A0A9P7HBG1_9HYPO|nr:hypothetical protein H9Q70_009945 [Fusarium xylarioides]KAG5757759.1 hypothetical protein H9Q72_014097 [Fusarium xylarioides]